MVILIFDWAATKIFLIDSLTLLVPTESTHQEKRSQPMNHGSKGFPIELREPGQHD